MKAVSLIALGSVLLVSACADRLDHLGKPPSMTPIDPSLPEASEATPIPMPPMPEVKEKRGAEKASLWSSNKKGLYEDRRAREVGDILTVLIDISDQAKLKNETKRSRDAEESAGVPGLFGFSGRLKHILPDGVDPSNLVELESESSSGGSGSVNRNENIQLKVAALVAKQLPNGNLIISGRQEVRVNFELRELRVAGIVRPEDITTDNTISYDKIAEARIAYGGRGHLSDVQQPRYGQQVLDMIAPF